ncbi:MAG: glycosyltransferase [Phycisphaerales bacterium]
MDLSIIIISWNTRDILRDCLRSVHDNLGDIGAEVLVVDNASTDGSAEMVEREFSGVHLIKNGTNRGFAAANNQAIRRARGRYFLLLNSDTVVLGDVLGRSVRYMTEHPQVAALGCRVLNPDRSLQPTCFAFPTLTYFFLAATGLHTLSWPKFFGHHRMRHWARDDERDVDVVTGCYLMIRRTAIDEVGALDESFFLYGEETDWCVRFKQAGWEVRFAPVGEIIHLGGASAGRLNERRELLLAEGLIRLHRKHGGVIAAAIAWTLLVSRHLIRAVALGAVSCFGRWSDAAARSKLHWATAGRFAEAWPRRTRTRNPEESTHTLAQSPIRSPARAQSLGRRRRAFRMPRGRGESEMRSCQQRILAVASGGGHWVQLLRLRAAFSGHHVAYVTVNKAYRSDVGAEDFYVINDATRRNWFALPVMGVRLALIFVRVRPTVVVTTGAAPGYFGVRLGKLLGARTVWLDSIANAEEVSLSGRQARPYADLWLTQWSHLARAEGPLFAGAVV